jgi:hypothetical protein
VVCVPCWREEETPQLWFCQHDSSRRLTLFDPLSFLLFCDWGVWRRGHSPSYYNQCAVYCALLSMWRTASYNAVCEIPAEEVLTRRRVSQNKFIPCTNTTVYLVISLPKTLHILTPNINHGCGQPWLCGIICLLGK